MTEWINVKDRLPSKDGEYLVAYKLNTTPPRWVFEVYLFALDLYSADKFDFSRKKYKGKSGFYFYDSEYGYCEDSTITYWMPLPEPPEESIPSVDVIERKKGKWIDYKCSECGEPIPISKVMLRGKVMWERDQKPNFCPNCGADMRGE